MGQLRPRLTIGAPNWPDPNNQGQFVKTAADGAKFRAPAPAYQACGHLLPDHVAGQPPVSTVTTTPAIA